MTTRTIGRIARRAVMGVVAALTLLGSEARAQGGPHTVIPVITCIEIDLAGNTYTTHFNYNNTGNTILLQLGQFNKFVPAPEFRGQPLLFEGGGINPSFEFKLRLPIGDTVSWALGTSSITSSLNHPLCNGAEILKDTDLDGEVDPTDRCPGTLEGEIVDDSGCSQAQFCEDKTRRVCKRSDWQNDEPKSFFPKDCTVDRGGRGRSDDRCVAR